MQHRRMKPKAVSKTTEEARFIERVASLGCLICGAPANVHHIMHAAGKERRRDHRFIAPLCSVHHQGDKKQGGVHGLGSENAFSDFWGVDLVAWCIEAWKHRNAPEALFWQDSVTRCRSIALPILSAIKAGGERERTNKRAQPALSNA